jgi:hypothetical protein
MLVPEIEKPDIFEALVRADVPDILTSECLTAAIEYKWKVFGQREWMKQVYICVVYILAYTAGLIFVNDPKANTYLGVGVFSIAWFINMYYIQLEYTNLVRDMIDDPSQIAFLIADYFSSFWNILDFINVTTVFCIGIGVAYNAYLELTIGAEDHSYRALGAFGGLLLIKQLMKLARGHKTLGQLIYLIMDILADMMAFTGVMLFCALANGFAFYLLAHPEDPYEQKWYGNIKVLIYTTYCLILGDFDDGMYTISAHPFYFFFFFVFTFFVDIVMLNALIAIMGGTYEKASETAEAGSNEQKSELIIEIQEALSDADNENRLFFPEWLHVISLAEEDDDQDDVVNAVEDAVVLLQAGQEKLLAGQERVLRHLEETPVANEQVYALKAMMDELTGQGESAQGGLSQESLSAMQAKIDSLSINLARMPKKTR